MTEAALSQRYRDYIACLSGRDWENLKQFVSGGARANAAHSASPAIAPCLNAISRRSRTSGSRSSFWSASRLMLRAGSGSTAGQRVSFLGLPVNGRRVSFAENVFYQFRDERIAEVWSVADKAAIEAQL
jgi:predicted ester cyclase